MHSGAVLVGRPLVTFTLVASYYRFLYLHNFTKYYHFDLLHISISGVSKLTKYEIVTQMEWLTGWCLTLCTNEWCVRACARVWVWLCVRSFLVERLFTDPTVMVAIMHKTMGLHRDHHSEEVTPSLKILFNNYGPPSQIKSKIYTITFWLSNILWNFVSMSIINDDSTILLLTNVYQYLLNQKVNVLCILYRT